MSTKRFDVRRWLKKTSLYEWLRYSAAYDIYSSVRQRQRYAKWERAGKPVPPPPRAKHLIVQEVAQRHACKILVETGTYRGDMVRACLDKFDQIYTIELNEQLASRAQKRFAKNAKVKVIQGDSSKELRNVLQQIDKPALFWLDAHFTVRVSSDIEGRGDKETAIVEELRHIAEHDRSHSHVILIDDARCFGAWDDYPSLDAVRDWARNAGYSSFEIVDDVIRIGAKN